MYDYIKGTLARKAENYVVIDVGGIGYKINTSAKSLQEAGSIHGVATFYTHLNVREDIFELYGFTTTEERSTFELLISVSGVGPKAALSILSSVSASSLAIAIVTNDAKAITAAQGVGPKLAQRIILELKDKIKNSDLVSDDKGTAFLQGSAFNEAAEALIVLGYSPTDALKAVKNAPDDFTVEETIKFALKQLL